MIAIDTSALMAILLDEPDNGACASALAADADRVMSAGTLAECVIVARGRDLLDEMSALLDELDRGVEAVTAAVARAVGDAYGRWGKGNHPAELNFGDCFAYELATRRACPLLFVGDGFSQTDVKSAI
ncbi:type II toxin-antitoxin system VapC family toxin [Aurantimonas sp. VKM B-3413]|uniref:type II toxin-antitoxin system VapC family toxin n=1 Tax=Aurantimonas sp. VKM B-3413 TaxID=2779401 RepID=UPI001E4C9337|nr:type II toxin-antitoxin system VapC family toxin [Aurantimonas sp. VKM B-3413]